MNKLFKSTKKLIVLGSIFALLLWTIGMPAGLFSIMPAGAATSFLTSTMGTSNSGFPPSTIKASSAAYAAVKMSVFTNQASKFLTSVTANFSGSGFSTTTDLAALATGAASGVALYDDAGGGNTSSFGTGDTVITASSTPVWSANNINIVPVSPVALTQNATTTFYLVIKTAASAVNNHAIIITLPANGITTTDGNGPASPYSASMITIDTQAPSIVKVERVNPQAVEVTYSENMRAGAATTTGNYAFSGGLTVTEAFMQSYNIFRVSANNLITVGSTTLTVNSSVTDLAGNANTSTSAITVTEANKVKISEVMPGISGANVKEFVELYNGGGTPVNVSNYKLHIRSSDGTDTNKVLTFNTSTIPAYGYFLIASAQYTDIGLTPDATYDATANDLNDNGGVYISESATAGMYEIDKVGWGSQPAGGYEGNPIGGPSLGLSLERKAFGSSMQFDMASGGKDANMGNGFDSNSNPFDFMIRTTPQPQNSTLFEQPNFGNYQGPSGAMIMHMPVNLAPTGSDLNIIAQMGDPQTSFNQITAELHYMVGDGTPNNNITADYTTIAGVHQSNGFFKFTIPQAAVDGSTTNGLYYYLKLITSSSAKYMSSSPSSDQSGNENYVAMNPFVATVQNSSSWTKHNITGTILTSTSTPVAGALVLLEGTGYNTTTATSGAFTLANVKDGNYNLIMIKENYYDNSFMNLYLNGANFSLGTSTLSSGTGGGMTGDTTKPMIKFTGPPDGMTGVPSGDANFKIFIGFTKDMSSSTMNNTNIYLSADGSTPISTAVVYDNDSSNNTSQGYPPESYLGIVSAPAGGFAANMTYYLIMTGDVRDTSGNALQGNRSQGGHAISFSTGGNYTSGGSGGSWTGFGTGAMMPPYVMGTAPFDGSMNIAPNIKINVNFSEPMDSASIATAGNIKLYKVTYVNNAESNTLITAPATLDTSGKVVTLTPSANLAAGKYRVVVTGAVKSATGIFLGNPSQSQNVSAFEMYRSNFEVGANTAVDTVRPTVSGTWPANNSTGIAVNPSLLTVQFSEGINPSTINANSITLKRGTTQVNGVVNYDPMSKSASFVPTVVLNPSTIYTFTIGGGATSTSAVTDMVGNAMLENYIVSFTTSATADTQAPKIMYANGDDYKIAISFNETMNSANITDSTNWAGSALKSSNYTIKYGTAGTATTSWTTISLASSTIKYEATNNTVMIENLGLTPAIAAGKNYYIDMSATAAADLSGNVLADVTTFITPINNSATTQGMLGPNMGGGGGGMTGPNMGDMGMKKAGAFPMNAMAGQTTKYFIDIPTAYAVGHNYKVVLTFPLGFDISGAKKDTNAPINNDVNEYGTGIIAFSTSTETSGGANNDGVTIDSSARTITITFSVMGTTPTGDFLHLDLDGIVNTSIARGFDTSGYSVDMKILDSANTLKETITTMPFFINSAGAYALSGTISLTGATGADDGTMNLYLGSPMTGPMNQIITITNGTSTYSFSGLPAGSYMLYTDSVITVNSTDWVGMTMPEPLNISATTTKNLSFAKQNSGSVLALTVNLAGNFQGNDIDIFAGSPSGFRVKTVTGAGNNPSAVTLYLPAGEWMVGVGPAMPKGPMSGPPPMPDWMPPMPQLVRSAGSGTSSITLSISSANIQIIGYVTDGVATTSYPNGTPIADAEVFAYQPMGGAGGMGSHSKTDTSGKFTLKVAQTGNYTVGAFKPGLPNAPEKSVLVGADTVAVDGNSTADITVDNRLITASNLFVIKLKKPAYTISGKVTNGTNPVSYAPVWANQAGSMGRSDSVTDSSGNFILYVDNGTWNLNSYIPGYGDAETQTVVVSGANVTQNLAPNSNTSYYTISGTITIGGTVQANMPIRAVLFNDNGVYTGKEYGSQTGSDGTYSISVPGTSKYRVDIWTPTYGEVGLDADEVANSPANITIASANVTGKNITIDSGSLITVTLLMTNKSGYSNKEGFVNINGATCTGSTCKPNNFNKSIRIANLAGTDQTVQLKANSNYFVMLDVPGFGKYIPDLDPILGRDSTTNSIIATSSDRIIKFTLGNTSSSTATVSGTVTDGTNNIANAWVWVGNPNNGYMAGTSTIANGTYSLTIPTGTGYKMNADKIGYMSNEPATLNAATAATTTTRNFTLAANTLTISGYLYVDTNANRSLDAGEAIANGWVRAETTGSTTTQRAQSPTDANGYFELGVINGTWKIYGMADGYLETYYGSTLAVEGASLTNKNISLASDPNWTNKSKMKPITPASGGTLDDTTSDGTGVKLTIPPNALGSSASAGNVTAQTTASVSETSSNEPFANQGVKITATDNSGQAITTLNDYIDIEKIIYKADVARELATGTITFEKLKSMNNGYWDSTSNDWVSLSTTRTAYYKTSAVATEWTLYTNSTATDTYEAFIDTIDAGTNYYDYKLVFTSKSNHLTIFAIIMPFVVASIPSTPATPSSNNSGNTGSVQTNYCQTVTLSDWGICANSWQTRTALSKAPAGCLLTSDQENSLKKKCEEVKGMLPEAIDKTVAEIKDKAKAFGQKITDMASDAAEIIKSNISSLLEKLKAKRDLAKENNSLKKYVKALIAKASSLDSQQKSALNNFLAYGTPTTQKLGEGERAGVVNSYKSAFGKLPTKENEWNDIVKIANGRWPNERNATTEKNAEEAFTKIYKRNPNRINPNDDAAVTVIAYGLRPEKRNTQSETAAIKSFRSIYGYQPTSATAWDIVRAIAYSGAKR